ncbi:hypothetical protein HDU86_004820 [Geranomyces michiganensis]|nr:hypothetical protein HDU86_004820 [Geranomyces michiganensis]
MLQEVQATLTWAIPSFRRQTNKITSPVFGPAACAWELSLYPEGHGQTRDTHMGLFLDVVKTEPEKAQGEAWSRPITSFRLSVMKRDSRVPIVMKEREPAGLEGFGKGFSHPRSWGWAALLPLNRLSEATTSEGTLIVHAEVVWQQRAELVGLLESQARDVPSSGGLLFNWRLADVTFIVVQRPSDSSQYGAGVGSDTNIGIGGIETHEGVALREAEDRDTDTVLVDDGQSGVPRLDMIMQQHDTDDSLLGDESEAESSGLGYYEEPASMDASKPGQPVDGPPSGDVNAALRARRSKPPGAGGVFDGPTHRPSSTTSSTASLPAVIPPNIIHHAGAAAAVTGMSNHVPLLRTHSNAQGFPAATIPAHRAILASRSDYFSAMFSSGLREAGGTDFSQPSVVEIHDFSVFAVRAMLEFLYTGRLAIPPSDRTSRGELIRLADRYQLAALHSYVGAMILEKDLNLDIALEILELADVYSSASGELKTACLGYVRENIGKLKIRDSFKDWVRSTDRRDLMVELFALM